MAKNLFAPHDRVAPPSPTPLLSLRIDSSGAVCFSSDFTYLPMLISHMPYAAFCNIFMMSYNTNITFNYSITDSIAATHLLTEKWLVQRREFETLWLDLSLIFLFFLSCSHEYFHGTKCARTYVSFTIAIVNQC